MTLQVTQDFYDKNPETVEKLLRALDKATNYINEHPEDAAKIIAKRINIDEKNVYVLCKKTNTLCSLTNNLLMALIIWQISC